MKIEEILEKRIMILDGAMGTMIQQYDLNENDFRLSDWSYKKDLKGNNDLLSITRPDIISSIHEKYLLAGADLIETNTFNATSISQSDYGTEDLVYRINFESANIAKKVCDKFSVVDPAKPRFVVGSIGPTNTTASISPDVNNPGYRAVDFDKLRASYEEQITALIDGGSDILLVETIFDTLNAKAALMAAENVFETKKLRLPLMVSGTITDASGRTLSGQTVEAFYISLAHFPLLSIGFNCALGAKELNPYLKNLSRISNTFTSAHPNAGLPNEFGEYDETPETQAEQIKPMLEDKLVNIVGGCCGTTPAHIERIASLATNYSPRGLQTILL